MDQKTNTQGSPSQQTWTQQNQGQQNPGQNTGAPGWQQTPSREPAEGARDEQERGPGSQEERNRGESGGAPRPSGISNRGMDRESEQEELPERGSER